MKNKEILYDEAKRSLKKFKGETCESSSISNSASTRIKLEPSFLAENEEALLAASYTRVKSNRGRGRGYPPRGSYSNHRGQRGGQTKGENSSVKKSINPTGSDGNLLTCKSCGSYRHLMAACPHSYENMSKVNTCTVDEEDVVLFTGFQKDDISNLGKMLGTVRF